MPLVSLGDFDKSLKINQLLCNQANPLTSNLINAQLKLIDDSLIDASCRNIIINNNLISTNPLLYHLQNQANKLIASGAISKANLPAVLNNAVNNAAAVAAAAAAAAATAATKHTNYSRYKTELCRQFIENGECKYGDKCQFAHGMNELKDVNRHPKYKTDFCKTFHSKGFCPYGPRCHFIHDLNEKFDPTRPNEATPSEPSLGGKTAASTPPLMLKQEALKPEAAKIVENQLDKQLEAIQSQLTSTLFLSINADLESDKSAEKKKQTERSTLYAENSQKMLNFEANSVMKTSQGQFYSNPGSLNTSPTSSSSSSSSSSSINDDNLKLDATKNKFLLDSCFKSKLESFEHFENDVFQTPRATCLVPSPSETPVRTRSSVSSTSSNFSTSSSNNSASSSSSSTDFYSHCMLNESPLKLQHAVNQAAISRPNLANQMQSASTADSFSSFNFDENNLNKYLSNYHQIIW